MEIRAKESTEESVKEGMLIIRKRAGSMFKMLTGMHEIMEEGCNVDLGEKKVDFVIETGNPAVEKWLEEFNDDVNKMVEEDDCEVGKDGPIRLEEALEAMTFYITLLLHQIVPPDMIRDACIHHASQHMTASQRDDRTQELIQGLAGAPASAMSGRQGPDQGEDPFKDIPELEDGEPIVVHTAKNDD